MLFIAVLSVWNFLVLQAPNTEKVTFSPYEKDELVAIVESHYMGKIMFDQDTLSLAAKTIRKRGGDARKMLDLVDKAVKEYYKCSNRVDCPPSDGNTPKPFVTMKHVIPHVRKQSETAGYIEGLPQVAKVILCVAVTLTESEGFGETIEIDNLRHFAGSAAMNILALNGDEFSWAFPELMQQLLDGGLLKSESSSDFLPSTVDLRFTQDAVKALVGLEEVVCAVDQDLFQKLHSFTDKLLLDMGNQTRNNMEGVTWT
jgi:hypothetical protein